MDTIKPDDKHDDGTRESVEGEPPVSLVEGTTHENQETQSPGEDADIPDGPKIPWATIWNAIRWVLRKIWHYLKKPTFTDWLVAVATVVIAVATWRTYTEIKTASQQTDKIIAADERIAKAIEGSLTQAQNAFTAANGQAILSQRAWIAIKINATVMPTPNGVLPPNPFIPGQPFDIRVSFKNTGRTPALNVKTVAKKDRFFQKEGKFQIPDFSYEPENYIFSGNLTPDVEVYGDIDFPPLTEDAIKQVTSNQVRVFVHGRTEYDDVFGVHHWQNYCGFLLPSGAMSICPYHNEMDQNQPN